MVQPWQIPASEIRLSINEIRDTAKDFVFPRITSHPDYPELKAMVDRQLRRIHGSSTPQRREEAEKLVSRQTPEDYLGYITMDSKSATGKKLAALQGQIVKDAEIEEQASGFRGFHIHWHKEAVKEALSKGLDVPGDVLKEYPGIEPLRATEKDPQLTIPNSVLLSQSKPDSSNMVDITVMFDPALVGIIQPAIKKGVFHNFTSRAVKRGEFGQALEMTITLKKGKKSEAAFEKIKSNLESAIGETTDQVDHGVGFDTSRNIGFNPKGGMAKMERGSTNLPEAQRLLSASTSAKIMQAKGKKAQTVRGLLMDQRRQAGTVAPEVPQTEAEKALVERWKKHPGRIDRQGFDTPVSTRIPNQKQLDKGM